MSLPTLTEPSIPDIHQDEDDATEEVTETPAGEEVPPTPDEEKKKGVKIKCL